MDRDEKKPGAAREGPNLAKGAGTTPAPEAGAGSPLPSVALPKGGGAIRSIGEKFSTNPATGTGSLSVPIATSPGRAGFELGLALGYDSGAGNGPFGLGWNLSIPSITRKTDKGLPRYRDGNGGALDVFVLSGGEDLVPVPLGLPDGTSRLAREAIENGDSYRIERYQPRTEGLFARIERWTRLAGGAAHWRVYTRDNVLSIYGRSASARIADPEVPGRAFSWLLEETRDDRGNVVRYTYAPEDGAGVDSARPSESNRFDRQPDGALRFRPTAQRYLKRVQYGNRAMVLDRAAPVPTGDGDYLFEVVFDYGERAAPADAPATVAPEPVTVRPWPARRDPFSTYRSGFEVRTYRLCRRVLMFHRFDELGPAPCLVRSTDFEYEEGPAVTYLKSVTHAGYLRQRDQAGAPTDLYTRAHLPPLELGYVKPQLCDELRVVEGESLQGIRHGVEPAGAQWADLDGEGIPGVVIPSERAWSYKRNLGGGKLGPPVILRALPSPAELAGGIQQLTDLGGDGNLDLVSYAAPLAGFFERTLERGWAPFAALRDLPSIDWEDPNLRFIDLDGDGLADVLITESNAFIWYRSRGKGGFDPALVVPRPKDERKGPAVLFADGTETIQLADMSGDGLADIVRVRNGEVCYWPNIGHGRFGQKVTLDQSPDFDAPGEFDPKRIRFADVDGSGTSDIVYLGRDGVRIYANQSGNGLAPAVALASLPPVHSLVSLSIADLLGQGTACLVWSSSLPGGRPLAYVDLMGGRKPHLLERIANSMGAETRISYASSTRFYLEDQAKGTPWLTRLPFPVQVIERIERDDHVSRTKLVTRFAYHHGYFDGREREFRGFARVEQWDAESFGDEPGDGRAGDELVLPPVRTVTWFHTGAWLERERLELALAEEYYAQDPRAPLLPDTQLPPGLSLREEQEAARALRGQVLRQEVYAEDGSPEAPHPYTVSERAYEVKLLRHAGAQAHAVFFVHPKSTINANYERSPADPRLQHEVVIQVDDFGNVLQSAAVAYPRRSGGEPEQGRLWVTYTARTFANKPDEESWYRAGVSIDSRTSEITGLTPPAHGVFTAEELESSVAAARPVPYEAPATPGAEQRRVVESVRHRYSGDDLAPLPFGQIESRALPLESYRQAFTPGLLAREYGDRVTSGMLADEGGYLFEDGGWWASSGRTIFDAAQFFLPVEAVDPFGHRHHVRYDEHALLIREVEDPLQNRVTAESDYRVLAPVLLTDPNLNRTAVELDALGMVVKTAAMGKAGAGEGDTLDAPTTRFEYDVLRWKNSNGARPVFARALAREQHGTATTRWQESYEYSDGSGRSVMRKVQAEPGEVPVFDDQGQLLHNPDGSVRTRFAPHRWVGTGRTVFDNKGHPVKKYEPFFSDTFEYEDERQLVEWGVTPVLRYDPLGRLVRTDRPNGTTARVIFGPWRQESWDENDTVAGTPWLARKQAGNVRERRCAALALAHAGTPTVAQFDGLGRVFLTVVDNGPEGLRATRMALDLEGNQTSVTDARGNLVVRRVFDMLAREVRVVRADAGGRDATGELRAVPVERDPGGTRTFIDAANKPVRAWLDRGFTVRPRYDALQRRTHLLVHEPGGDERLVELTVYGESLPSGVAQGRNLRTRACQVYDGAGALERIRIDFKGNEIQSARRLAKLDPPAAPPAGWNPYEPDWSLLDGLDSVAAIEAAASPLLEPALGIQASYDALNRAVSRTTPDGSETRPSYNEAGLLERIEVRLRGGPALTTFVSSVDYNARGQRVRAEYGGGSQAGGPATSTSYEYDPETFRLIRQRTVRTLDGELLQDLGYEHDPVGNVVQVTDRVSFGRAPDAPVVDPEANVSQRLLAGYGDGAFVYDALYQLVEARGRHHPGQQPGGDEDPPGSFIHPNDPQGLEGYRQSYEYDRAGNILVMATRATGGGAPSWTRRYSYAPDCNRLLRTSATGDPPGTLSADYGYDPAGNMVRMPHLPEMQWSFANRLKSVRRQIQAAEGAPNDVHFIYDASGERVRKVYEHGSVIEERAYLAGYETYSKRTRGDPTPALERQTLHVLDDRRRVALVETKSADSGMVPFVLTTRLRFQLEGYLGSSLMELDEAGGVIGYEEYYPFGGSSFCASSAATDVSPKRYRYIGKERDQETGLYSCGARYYAAWLGRWTSCDPLGLVDGANVYWYARNNPMMLGDPAGTKGKPSPQMVNPEIVVPGKFSGKESQEAIRSKYAEAGIFYKGNAVWDKGTHSWWVDRSQISTPQEMTFEAEEIVVTAPRLSKGEGGKQEGGSVGQPGFAESLIPIWGSGRSAIDHFQRGNWGRGVLFTALAVSDVFLVKSLVTAGGKLLVKGGAKLLTEEAVAAGEKELAKEGVEVAAKEGAGAAAKEGTATVAKEGTAELPKFTQTTASVAFKNGPFAGKTIGEVAAGLRSGAINPGQLPVDVIVRNGQMLALNTRSALALMRGGLDVSKWTIINRTGDVFFEKLLTERLARNGLTELGTEVLRITGAGKAASAIW